MHVGERVLSANAAKGIDDETFAEFSKQLEAGSFDHNAFRQFLKLPPKPGYATGSAQRRLPTRIKYSQNQLRQARVRRPDRSSPTAALTNTTPTSTIPSPGNYDTIINQTFAGMNAQAEGTSPTVQRETNAALRQYDTGAAADIQQNNQVVAAQPNVPQASQVAQMGQGEPYTIGKKRTDRQPCKTNEQNAQKAAADAAKLAASERTNLRATQKQNSTPL